MAALNLKKIAYCIHQCLIIFIKFYQMVVSPLLGPHCRFFPTCSQYTLEAIQNYGIFRGLLLGLKRIIRCQPFCKSGLDPIHKLEC